MLVLKKTDSIRFKIILKKRVKIKKKFALAPPAAYPLMLITRTLLMQTMPRPSVACTNLIAYPIEKNLGFAIF